MTKKEHSPFKCDKLSFTVNVSLSLSKAFLESKTHFFVEGVLKRVGSPTFFVALRQAQYDKTLRQAQYDKMYK